MVVKIKRIKLLPTDAESMCKRCIDTYYDTLIGMIETTRKTGNEMGALFCMGTGGECDIGMMCTGSECNIVLRDCAGKLGIGSFHTHPGTAKAIPSFGDIIHNVASNYLFFCIGSNEDPEVPIRCYRVKRDSTYLKGMVAKYKTSMVHLRKHRDLISEIITKYRVDPPPYVVAFLEGSESLPHVRKATAEFLDILRERPDVSKTIDFDDYLEIDELNDFMRRTYGVASEAMWSEIPIETGGNSTGVEEGVRRTIDTKIVDIRLEIEDKIKRGS